MKVARRPSDRRWHPSHISNPNHTAPAPRQQRRHLLQLVVEEQPAMVEWPCGRKAKIRPGIRAQAVDAVPEFPAPEVEYVPHAECGVVSMPGYLLSRDGRDWRESVSLLPNELVLRATQDKILTQENAHQAAIRTRHAFLIGEVENARAVGIPHEEWKTGRLVSGEFYFGRQTVGAGREVRTEPERMIFRYEDWWAAQCTNGSVMVLPESVLRLWHLQRGKFASRRLTLEDLCASD